MKRWFLSLSIVLVAASVYAQTGPVIPEMAGVDTAIQNFMRVWNIPGASVAIAKDGRLVYARGFGLADKNTGEQVYPHSRFRIASISKPITATAIFKLIEAGTLSLTDKVFGPNAILGNNTSISDTRYLNITIKNLLSHTGGWDRFGARDPMFMPLVIANFYGIAPPAMQDDILRFMLGQQLDFTPGSRQVYANFGYSVLGRVIEKVTGMPYADYVQTVVFDEVGAKSFSLAKNLLKDRQKNEVAYYDHPGALLFPSVYGTGEKVPDPYGGVNVEAMDSHGGWITSAPDLLRFGLAVDGKNTRPDILNANSIRTMKTPGLPNGPFGHGWLPYQGGFYHTGLLPGSSSQLDLTENRGIAVVVLFNSQSYQNRYFSAMDNALWGAINSITSWPAHDLFGKVTATEQEQPDIEILDLVVYPNPTYDKLNIRLASLNQGQILITDMLGRQVLQRAYAGTQTVTLDVSHLAGGVYQLSVEGRKTRATRLFIRY